MALRAPGAAIDWNGPRPRWKHRTEDYDRRRVTVSFGPWRVGFQLSDGLLDGWHWRDPPGLAADLELMVGVASDRRVIGASPRFERSATGFSYHGEWASAEVDLGSGRGAVELDPSANNDVEAANRAVLEVARALALDVLVRRGGLMLHACMLAFDGRSYVVSGPSDAGKSTLAFRFDDSYLAHEYAYLVPGPGGAWTSWWHAQSRGPWRECPWTMPVGGILRLTPERGQTAIHPTTFAERVSVLTSAAFWCAGLELQDLLDNAMDLARAHPVSLLDHALTTPVDELRSIITSGGRP
jgi:hypothetical protein